MIVVRLLSGIFRILAQKKERVCLCACACACVFMWHPLVVAIRFVTGSPFAIKVISDDVVSQASRCAYKNASFEISFEQRPEVSSFFTPTDMHT